jgi:hypothetical protein
MISFKVPANPAALRIIAEALQKLAGVFESPADVLDPGKTVTSKEIEKLAVTAVHEKVIAEALVGLVEDVTPPVVPPGAFGAPPVAVTTPPAEPTPPAATPPGVELDADGLPWDARINADSRGTVKDGTWRLKKQLDPAFLESVKTELRAAMAAATVPPAPPAATVPPAPPAATVPPAPPAATVPAAPQADSEPAPLSFAGFIQAITKRQVAGTLTVQEVNQVCARYGLATMALLNSRPDLIPAIYEELRAVWTTRG